MGHHASLGLSTEALAAGISEDLYRAAAGQELYRRPWISPLRLARLLLAHSDHLWTKHVDLLRLLTAACPKMAQLTAFIHDFAALLTLAGGNDSKLTEWISRTRDADPPHLHSFSNVLEIGRAAVNAGLTLP